MDTPGYDATSLTGIVAGGATPKDAAEAAVERLRVGALVRV